MAHRERPRVTERREGYGQERRRRGNVVSLGGKLQRGCRVRGSIWQLPSSHRQRSWWYLANGRETDIAVGGSDCRCQRWRVRPDLHFDPVVHSYRHVSWRTRHLPGIYYRHELSSIDAALGPPQGCGQRFISCPPRDSARITLR
jgi:hypothetical protein